MIFVIILNICLQLELLFDREGLSCLWNELVNNGELSSVRDNLEGISSGNKHGDIV